MTRSLRVHNHTTAEEPRALACAVPRGLKSAALQVLLLHLLCLGTLIALHSPAALADEDFIPAPALHKAGLIKFWQLQLPLEADQVLLDAYLVDDQLYLGTQDGYVFAVHAYTGAIRWLKPVTRSGYRIRRPCHAGGRVIFVTPVDVQIYDRLSGEGRARRELRFPARTAAVSDGRRFFVGGLDNRIYAFRVDGLFLDWRAVTDGPITSLPAIHGENVYVANEGGTVYACTRDRKVARWPNPAFTYGPITADLVVDDSGVYVASRDQSLYLFDLYGGLIRWRARLSSPLYEAPYVSRELAYQYSMTDGLVAVETGLDYEIEQRLRWKLPQGRQVLAVDQKYVYVRSLDEKLLAVAKKDGQVVHSIPAAGFTLGIPAQDTTIFLASPDGKLFCARPRGAPLLQQQDIAKALLPAEPGTADKTSAGRPTTQPAAEAPDYLGTKRGGVPIGGKSKVSRDFEKGDRSE
ncbi:MAG: PQQ-binding-like beta-propeller repeat protein [Phycisphaerae bacterium]|nr:PQQ-binding-like beta-propeller repeat protein [Phycisphaerae bacterium]